MGEFKTDNPATLKALERVRDIKANPDKYDKEPFQILDNIFYVGNKWVGAYIIDTGEGLILLDSNFEEVMHILYKNIRKMGFKFSDIKWLFVSHGHWDHTNGAGEIQQLTDCVTYFPKGDLPLIEGNSKIQPFRIDNYFEYGEKITCGNVTITPVHTPGHTPGCTSLFLEMPYRGRTVMLGVHGGLGLNGLTQKELIEKGWPLDMAEQYKKSLEQIRVLPVDIFLPLHNGYYDIFSLAEKDDGSHEVYLRPEDWKTTLDAKIEAVEKLMAEDK